MDASDLDRAAQEYAAALSEAGQADLATPAGQHTVGGLTEALIARVSALAAALGTAPPAPDGASGPPDAYGGGFERPFRRAARILSAAVAGAPSEPGAERELADLVRAVDAAAVAVSRAMGLD